ncbi:MAG: 5-demethoxyubiquinol-8 5-hydroxylase UbiM [Gammaproteobacteria bacterium]|nr:5-demethoxyubiquinol-8 5-hydroxylase UbiM [Gammaproteobacteria bacterium]MDH5311141.1 5-demethoxyubiquinol-8 5-hydroxylase UbiM [Gammaproteobacteria bacterium]
MDQDITIVGAGPAGLGFARMLAGSGLSVAIVDRQSIARISAPAFDGRDIALTHQSIRILEHLGAWDRIGDTGRSAIREARVQDGTSPYTLEFAPGPDTSDVLGYIVSNHLIRKALYDEVRDLDNVTFVTDASVSDVRNNAQAATVFLDDGRALSSRLVIAADSRYSDTRRMMGIPAEMHDFGRVCIVCRANIERPHDGIAFECFHYGRTLAVLPLVGDLVSVVITAPMDQRGAIMDLDQAAFDADLQLRFGDRLGRMELASERYAYPLVGVHAARFQARRFALVGDAAVGMHPVTAHGFNLGLSGAEILAGEVLSAARQEQDIGASELLRRYESRHMRKTRPMYRGTNEIVRLFTDDRLPVRLARQAVLRMSNNLPPVKRIIRNLLTEPGRPRLPRPPLPRRATNR